MQRLILFLTVAFFLFFASSSLNAAHPTPTEARAMAEKAASYLHTEGVDKAAGQFQRSQGPFRKGELYIFVLNLNGEIIANGARPQMIGTDLLDRKDPDGKGFGKQIVQGAKAKGCGWVDYKWTNPTTKKVAPKTTYYVKAGDYIVCCGAYKN